LGGRGSWHLGSVLDAFEFSALLHDLLAELLHLIDGRGALAYSGARQPADVVQDLLTLTATDVVGGRKKAHDDVVDFVGGHGGRGCRLAVVGRDEGCGGCVGGVVVVQSKSKQLSCKVGLVS